jgi:hypothetical protein
MNDCQKQERSMFSQPVFVLHPLSSKLRRFRNSSHCVKGIKPAEQTAVFFFLQSTIQNAKAVDYESKEDQYSSARAVDSKLISNFSHPFLCFSC